MDHRLTLSLFLYALLQLIKSMSRHKPYKALDCK